MILETDRLILRELTTSDLDDLCRLLQDPEVMYAYEGPFSDLEVEQRFDRQQARYIVHGFGLWAVVRQKDGIFVGQCGITLQPYRGRQVPELGYLLCRRFWHRGYATEAAAACKGLAFGSRGMQHLYAFIRDTNFAPPTGSPAEQDASDRHHRETFPGNRHAPLRFPNGSSRRNRASPCDRTACREAGTIRNKQDAVNRAACWPRRTVQR